MVDVSVVIPTFRREREVVLAIESALTQKAVSLEVIVLDDSPEGSAREAVEAVHDSRVRYVKRSVPSGGAPAIVRNEGARLASGAFLHFLDDDDRLVAGALAALVGALERSGRGVAFGYVVPFGDDEVVLARQKKYFERARASARRRVSRIDMTARLLFETTLLVNSACIVRQSCFESVGGYDAGVRRCEDVDFYLRAIRAHGFSYVDRPVLEYRTGASSLMHDLADNTKVEESYRKIHAKYRSSYGAVELYALKAFARLTPSRTPRPDDPTDKNNSHTAPRDR
jgi:GT2 family glycosyltransferase